MKKKGSSILKYLKPYWIFAVLAPLVMVGEVVCDLMQPTLMSKIVDEGVLSGQQSVIFSVGLRMIIIAVLGGIAGIACSAFSGIASQSFGNDLRKDVYKNVMELSFEQTDHFTTGSLVTRLTNDVSMAQQLVEMCLRMFVRAPLTFLGGIVMAISLDIRFAIVLAVMLPIQVVVIWLILAKAGPLFSIVQEKLDNVNNVVQENVSGARVVKAYVQEDYETERFDKANLELTQKNYKVQKTIATLSPFLNIVMNVGVIAIIYIGGLQVEALNMKVGTVMAAVTYTTQVLMSVMMVSMMFQSLSRGRASIRRIREVLDSVDYITDGPMDVPADFKGNVTFENVHFTYPEGSGLPVLSGVNLEVKAGETLAILGSTGAGKTSLINLLPRFYDCTEGSVKLDGIDVRQFKLDSLRGAIAVVLQKSELFSGTIRDNIRWGKEEATDEEIKEAARIAQADEFISGFNLGYDSQVGEKGSALSGGQKQRISIARALVRKPKILIFDDSTSALDLGTESRLRKALHDSCSDMTVIMIAQRVASVKNADKIAVLEKGQIVAVGTHDELMETCPVYIDIYNSQNKSNNGKEAN